MNDMSSWFSKRERTSFLHIHDHVNHVCLGYEFQTYFKLNPLFALQKHVSTCESCTEASWALALELSQQREPPHVSSSHAILGEKRGPYRAFGRVLGDSGVKLRYKMRYMTRDSCLHCRDTISLSTSLYNVYIRWLHMTCLDLNNLTFYPNSWTQVYFPLSLISLSLLIHYHLFLTLIFLSIFLVASPLPFYLIFSSSSLPLFLSAPLPLFRSSCLSLFSFSPQIFLISFVTMLSREEERKRR